MSFTRIRLLASVDGEVESDDTFVIVRALEHVRVPQRADGIIIAERWAEAEMHRLRGTLLLSTREHAAAEESYQHALAVARRQSEILGAARRNKSRMPLARSGQTRRGPRSAGAHP